jgi:hypothetical protein
LVSFDWKLIRRNWCKYTVFFNFLFKFAGWVWWYNCCKFMCCI